MEKNLEAILKAKLNDEDGLNLGLTNEQVSKLVEAYEDATVEAVFGEPDQRFTQRGFLGIDIRLRPARTGRNPNTGDAIQIPEQYVLKHRFGSKFKERLKQYNAEMFPEQG